MQNNRGPDKSTSLTPLISADVGLIFGPILSLRSPNVDLEMDPSQSPYNINNADNVCVQLNIRLYIRASIPSPNPTMSAILVTYQLVMDLVDKFWSPIK